MGEGMIVANDDMCRFAFAMLEAHAYGRKMPRVPDSIPETDSCAVFVTWKKRSRDGHRYRLRGCIGTLSPMSLHEGLKTYSIAAASQDKRFPPIKASEIRDLQVCVSLLVNFEPAPNGIYDWAIGTHGLLADFHGDSKRYTATYLPEVCYEQGWTQDECLKSLIRKAGFEGPVTQDILESMSITRYQSSKHSMHFSDYQKLMYS